MKGFLHSNYWIGGCTLLIMVLCYRFTMLGILIPLLVLACAVLLVANIVAVFSKWKEHRARAFLPLGVYAIFIGLLVVGTRPIARVVLDPPAFPDTFLSPKNQALLETAAEVALEDGIGDLTGSFIPLATPTITRVDGSKSTDTPKAVTAPMRRFGFLHMKVDHDRSIVIFDYHLSRTWYYYIYSKHTPLPITQSPGNRGSLLNDSDEYRIDKQLADHWYFHRY